METFSNRWHYCATEYFNMLNISLCMIWYWEDIYSRFFSNSEAFSSELLQNSGRNVSGSNPCCWNVWNLLSKYDIIFYKFRFPSEFLKIFLRYYMHNNSLRKALVVHSNLHTTQSCYLALKSFSYMEYQWNICLE